MENIYGSQNAEDITQAEQGISPAECIAFENIEPKYYIDKQQDYGYPEVFVP
jgi:hypothetical protein